MRVTARAKPSSPRPKPSIPRLVGRPRRLTLERLLDGAIEQGLQDLNMKELAARLGVGIATLYRYVESREALIRLATGRQVERNMPVDDGQPWDEMVRAYAAALSGAIGQDPQIVIGFLEGRWGIGVEVEFVDAFLGAMAARDVPAEDAMQLYRQMAQVVLGAAIAAGHFAALAARGADQAGELARALAGWDADELPHLRAAASGYADQGAAAAWRPALDAILRDAARRRQTNQG